MGASIAYIALGSNVGDRRAAIESALRALGGTPGVQVTATSTIIETAPEGPLGQPAYLNAAAALATTLAPRELLERLLAIEVQQGRDRAAEQRWGPRRLDLDLLLYDDRIIDEPDLTVPHPRLHERAFVLTPLADIAETTIHPLYKVSIKCLCRRLA